MRTAIFMMPQCYTRKGKVPLDYLFVKRVCDKRTNFYKKFASCEISVDKTVCVAEEYGMQVFREGGELIRILAPDGKTAEAFYKRMTNLGYAD